MPLCPAVVSVPRAVRRGLLGAALLVSGALPVRAQQSPPPPPAIPAEAAPEDSVIYPWRTTWLPSLGGGTNDGPMLGVRLRAFQMAAYEDRIANLQTLSATAGVSPRGSFLGFVRYQAPRIGSGWRLWAQVLANRETRFGYFGLGNTTVNPDGAATETDPFPFRTRRTRFEARADLTRRITGPLNVVVGAHLQLARFNALRGASVFRNEYGDVLRQSDAAARVALLVDTRNAEYDPQRGVLLEAGAEVASGNGGYERLYSILRGYAPLGPRTVVAARVLGSALFDNPTLDARFTVPAWENPVDVLGGQFSHRGLEFGRLAGRGVLLTNLEVRQEVLNIKQIADVIVVGFLDAGRVFEPDNLRLTTQEMKVAGGLGFGVKLLRTTVFTINVARGPEGTQFSANSGWMF